MMSGKPYTSRGVRAVWEGVDASPFRRMSGSLPHDTFIYLGGNEQSTHKYVSELLGKGTIDKKSSGETRGRQGSSSRNYDVLGRELFTADEVRKLDNKKCIIFIRGFDPIMDNKYVPFAHPMFKQTADGGGKPYEHERTDVDGLIGPPFQLLTKDSLNYFEKLKESGENIYIDEISYEAFMLLGQAEMNKRFSDLDEAQQKARFNKEQENELEYDEVSEITNKPINREKYRLNGEDSFTARTAQWEFTDEQLAALELARQKGVPKRQLYKFFYPSVSAEKMRKIWNV